MDYTGGSAFLGSEYRAHPSGTKDQQAVPIEPRSHGVAPAPAAGWASTCPRGGLDGTTMLTLPPSLNYRLCLAPAGRGRSTPAQAISPRGARARPAHPASRFGEARRAGRGELSRDYRQSVDCTDGLASSPFGQGYRMRINLSPWEVGMAGPNTPIFAISRQPPRGQTHLLPRTYPADPIDTRWRWNRMQRDRLGCE